MWITALLAFSGLAFVTAAVPPAYADPPFSRTIFIDPDIITPTDATAFVGATYVGQGFRSMYDRRVNDFVYLNAFLIAAAFDDGATIEVEVNPEFGTSSVAQ